MILILPISFTSANTITKVLDNLDLDKYNPKIKFSVPGNFIDPFGGRNATLPIYFIDIKTPELNLIPLIKFGTTHPEYEIGNVFYDGYNVSLSPSDTQPVKYFFDTALVWFRGLILTNKNEEPTQHQIAFKENGLEPLFDADNNSIWVIVKENI